MKEYNKSYKEWLDFLGDKHRKKLCHKTEVYRVYRNAIVIYYQASPIVSIYNDGKLILNSCGWLSQTTKKRINQLTPTNFQVYQQDFIWYCTDASGDTKEFYEGILINKEGYFI